MQDFYVGVRDHGEEVFEVLSRDEDKYEFVGKKEMLQWKLMQQTSV
jgi:hypothetical protein